MPYSISGVPQGQKLKVAVLLVLAIITLAFAFSLTNAGHLSVDEIVYHLMARDFAASGSLTVQTGFEEFPSLELSYPVTHALNGRLVPQYPSLYPILAAPLYWIVGYRGLFVLNAFALMGVAWLCYATAQKLFRDRDLSLNAALILLLATFSWEHSQASWPHAMSMLFVAGAVYLSIFALEARPLRSSLSFAFAAGVVAGFGTGVRTDVFFVLPALLLPFLFARPLRIWQGLAVLAGTLPGLAVVAATNYVKFGITSPFSYGPYAAGSSVAPTTYIPVFLMGLSGAIVLWVCTRAPMYARIRTHWRSAFVVAVVVVAAVLFAAPEILALLVRLTRGAYQLLIDLRVRDLGIVEGGLTRGPGGGLIYMGALKKSLLQSCPYLVALIVPLVHLLRGGRDAPSLGLLFLVPGIFIAVFSYFSWHGGLSLNLRYFSPILPFTSILTAYALRELICNLTGRHNVLAGGAVAGAFVLVIGTAVVPLNRISIAGLETVLLTLPLLFAAGLLGAVLFWMFSPQPARNLVGRFTAVALIVGFAWSGMVAFTYDFPRAWMQRSVAVHFFRKAAPLVPLDSIVFADFVDPVTGLYDLDRVRVAHVTRDNFKTFRPLADFHLDAERPVFAWFHADTWETARTRGLLDGLDVEPLSEIGGRSLARINRVAGATFLAPKPAGGGALGQP